MESKQNQHKIRLYQIRLTLKSLHILGKVGVQHKKNHSGLKGLRDSCNIIPQHPKPEVNNFN